MSKTSAIRPDTEASMVGKIPDNPKEVYKDQWTGWNDFLGVDPPSPQGIINDQEEAAEDSRSGPFSETLTVIFNRYAVRLRTEDTTVPHDAYEQSYIVPPEQFRLFEAFCKASYVAHMISNMKDAKEFSGCLLYHKVTIFDPYGIDAPWIKDEWGAAERKQATEDTYSLRLAMDWKKVKHAKTGEDEDLYYALLD